MTAKPMKRNTLAARLLRERKVSSQPTPFPKKEKPKDVDAGDILFDSRQQRLSKSSAPTMISQVSTAPTPPSVIRPTRYIVPLAKSGMRVYQIARKLGLPYTTVTYRVKRAGLWHPRKKFLTNEQKAEIRVMRARGVRQCEICRSLGLSKSAVGYQLRAARKSALTYERVSEAHS